MASSLFFHPENGCDMFLQKCSCLSTDYTVLYPGRILCNTLLQNIKEMEKLLLLKYAFHEKHNGHWVTKVTLNVIAMPDTSEMQNLEDTEFLPKEKYGKTKLKA
jgi:hypothetical protein